MGDTTVFDCRVLQLPKVNNPAGNLTAINSSMDIPFEIKRVYFLYDLPAGEERGGHAHYELQQLIIASSGSFDVVLKDGKDERVVTLNRPFTGLLMVPGIWRELRNFSSGSISLVLASDHFRESDYIRDYQEFLKNKLSATA